MGTSESKSSSSSTADSPAPSTPSTAGSTPAPLPFVVLNAASGVGLSTAAGRLKASLEEKEYAVALVDLEDILLEEVAPAHLGNKYPDMRSLLWYQPRDLVSRVLWPAAAQLALAQLAEVECDIRILVCHLTYYRAETREFYEPASYLDMCQAAHSEAFLPLKIACVVTLIDDVFDMFVRLAPSGQVFDIASSVLDEHRRRSLNDEAPKDRSDCYTLAFEQVTGVLFRLLAWRSRETAAGDSLANNARASHYVFGVKHPTELAVDLVECELELAQGRFPVYLSHPISRPRKQQKVAKDLHWPPFVVQFHNFVNAVQKQGRLTGTCPLLFMPTAIDEYRLIDRPSAEGFPGLHRRWPLLRRKTEESLYEIPGGFTTYDEYERELLIEEIFNPKGSGSVDLDYDDPEKFERFASSASEVGKGLSERAKAQIQSLLNTFLYQIRIQLAQRDHALVRQTGRLLLYRPLYDGPRFSGGVQAEIDNWVRIVLSTKALLEKGGTPNWRFGSAVFVHDQTDVKHREARVATLIRSSVLSAVGNEIGPQQRSRFDLGSADFSNAGWVIQAYRPAGELLSGGPDPEEVRATKKKLVEIWQRESEKVRKEDLIGTAQLSEEGLLHAAEAVVIENLGECTSDDLKEIVVSQILPPLAWTIT